MVEQPDPTSMILMQVIDNHGGIVIDSCFAIFLLKTAKVVSCLCSCSQMGCLLTGVALRGGIFCEPSRSKIRSEGTCTAVVHFFQRSLSSKTMVSTTAVLRKKWHGRNRGHLKSQNFSRLN